MTNEKKNPILLYIIFAIIVVVVCCHFYPDIKAITQPKHQQIIENRIDDAETYYDKAKALSISMPLLSDSIIYNYADGLYKEIVDLNEFWVRYVATYKDFNKYTDEIEGLSNKMDSIRVQYELARAFREMRKQLQEQHAPRPRQWNNKKNSTQV